MGMSADDQLANRIPGGDATAETDTSPTGPGAVPPAGVPAKQYAGKYNSPEDLEKGYQDLESKLGEQGEELRRMRDLLLTPPVGAAFPAAIPTAPEWPDVSAETIGADAFISRAEAERIATEKGRAEAQRILREGQEQDYWRGEFSRRNPDLKDYGDLVQAKIAEIGQKYAHLPPDWVRARMPFLLDEVAQRTRERLAAIRTGIKAEVAAEQQKLAEGQTAGSLGPAAPAAPQRELSLDDQRLEAIREEMRAKQAIRQKTLR